MTQPHLPQVQCKMRQQHCVWNATKAACVSPCDDAPPKANTIRSMCAAAQVTANAVSGRFIRLLGTNFLDHTAESVTGNGDFDGDGRIDIAIGIPDAPPKGEGRPGTGSINLITYSLGITTRGSAPRQTLLRDVHYRINGTYIEGQFGDKVVFVDLDKDGLDDLVVSATYASPLNRERAGQVYVIWGRTDFADAWSKGFYDDIESLPAQYVLRIPGEMRMQSFGSSLADAGDFDKDGYKDLIIGAQDSGVDGRSRSGDAFILYGRARHLFGENPIDITKTRSTRISGPQAFANFGSAVSGGDVNNDLYSDVVVGAPWGGIPAGTGVAYVIFGRPNPPALIDLLNASYLQQDGKWNFLTLEGEAKAVGWANFGKAVSILGDVNVDGFRDIAVSAPLLDNAAKVKEAGRLYVFFGREEPVASLSITSLLGYEGGFIVDGTGVGDFFGSSIASGFVDFNGDGYADILTSSPSRTVSAKLQVAGEATVIYGRCTRFPATIPIRGKVFQGVGTHIQSQRGQENLGISVAAAGDLDRDGRTDLLLGAHFSDRERGAAYIAFSC